MPQIIGEYLDRLVTVEMRSQGRPRGFVRQLYDAAREDAGAPLSLLAARGLIERVGADATVVFGTGAGSPPFMPEGETDGPMGTAALARAVHVGLGALPIVLCADHHVGPVVASLRAAGLAVLGLDAARQKARNVAVVIPFTTDDAEARALAPRLLDEFRPSALVSVEKLGPNAKGIAHTASGLPGAAPDAKIYTLFEEARRRGILTIGVADGGNEIGCGRIYEAVRRHHPNGGVCKCPCGAGMATTVATDLLMFAAVSNWGAYAIEAMLSFLLGRPELLHSPALEEHMLVECVRAGAFDGGLGAPVLGVDGTARDVSPAIVRLMAEIVHNGSRTIERGF